LTSTAVSGGQSTRSTLSSNVRNAAIDGALSFAASLPVVCWFQCAVGRVVQRLDDPEVRLCQFGSAGHPGLAGGFGRHCALAPAAATRKKRDDRDCDQGEDERCQSFHVQCQSVTTALVMPKATVGTWVRKRQRATS
jgi:hypothetical protein